MRLVFARRNSNVAVQSRFDLFNGISHDKGSCAIVSHIRTEARTDFHPSPAISYLSEPSVSNATKRME